MSYAGVRGRLPGWVRARVQYFEARIEEALVRFAAGLPAGARLLDAGAGEARHSTHFNRQRYTAVDLAIGDANWDYSRVDTLADLGALPFAAGCFQAAINIVTLEHVRDPARVLGEIARVLAPGGRLLLVVPQDWEVHQPPHDYFRYTCFGVRYLLEKAGFTKIAVEPVGGIFRLLSRRLLNSLQFFPGVWFWVAAVLFAPAALLLPLFELLDRERNFTLGYICTAEKPS